MNKKEDNIWVPVSDLMSSLMLIFLLLIVLLLAALPIKSFSENLKVQKFTKINEEIFEELDNALHKYKQDWGLLVTKDLEIKFKNPNIIFEQDSDLIKPQFINILNQFIPIYIGVINKEKYNKNIKEIKIEGHTAGRSPVYPTYIDTIKLSQNRSRNILDFILASNYFNQLSKVNQDKIIFWLSANGYGYSKTVDSNFNYVYNSNKEISPLSRRVEFRIITNAEDLVNDFQKNNNHIEAEGLGFSKQEWKAGEKLGLTPDQLFEKIKLREKLSNNEVRRETIIADLNDEAERKAKESSWIINE